MASKIAIIGAGLAGLSAGIHLQQKGIETEIFELAPWAGGMCTAWVRNGHRFDGCIHWMVGTKPGDSIYKLYMETGVLDESTKIHNADSIRTEIKGKMYEIPLEFHKFKALLMKYAKGDEEAIDGLMKDISMMMKTSLPLGAPANAREAADFLLHSRGFIKLARKCAGKTVKEYLQDIKSETVIQILDRLIPSSFCAIALVMMLGTRMSGNAGYPLGGALEVIERMEKKYRDLGGILHFNARVDEILVEKGAAKGVRVKGTVYPADGVIAACDAFDTLKNMLDGKYTHPQLNEMLESAPLFDSLALISFGLDKRFDIPFMVTYECPEGIHVSPDTISHAFSLRSFDFDEKAAPVGGSSVMVMMDAPLSYWVNLRKENMEEYKRQKQILAGTVADAIEKRIPGFKNAIRITDVSTPATYVRLTNVYKGSFEGFAPVPTSLKRNIQKRIPGLNRLYLCGQWTTAGGGICAAVADGKTAAGKIAKELR